MEERLQKFLANQGISSRRKAEQYILEGKVKVNGKVVTEPGTKINTEIDKIEFNEKLVDLQYAMNVVASYETLQSYQEQFQRNESVSFNKDRFLKKCEEFEFESIIKQYSV